MIHIGHLSTLEKKQQLLSHIGDIVQLHTQEQYMLDTFGIYQRTYVPVLDMTTGEASRVRMDDIETIIPYTQETNAYPPTTPRTKTRITIPPSTPHGIRQKRKILHDSWYAIKQQHMRPCRAKLYDNTLVHIKTINASTVSAYVETDTGKQHIILNIRHLRSVEHPTKPRTFIRLPD